MLNLGRIARISSPAYFLRPQQIVKRIWHEYQWKNGKRRTIDLPWNLPLRIDPQESLGHNLKCQGIYDLSVTEALWSLTDSGELAIDAGANIGYMTSLLLKRVGKTGYVIAFEPHPTVFSDLSENAALWESNSNSRHGTLSLCQAALGDKSGEAVLHCNDWFLTNRGTASLVQRSSDGDRSLNVKVLALDDLTLPLPKIHIVKIDVEGAELAVLQGMTKLLDSKSVRDIVFEETKTYPAESHLFLASKGYSLFALRETFRGLSLLSTSEPKNCERKVELPSYLATVDPVRAVKRLDRRFWRSIGPLRIIHSFT